MKDWDTTKDKNRAVSIRLPKDLWEWYDALPLRARGFYVAEAIRNGKDGLDSCINLEILAKFLDDTNDAVEGLNRRQNTYDLALLHLQTRIEKLEESSAAPPE